MENEKFIWNSLKNNGFNDFAVAGIMGNIQAESNGKPNNLQGSYERSLGYTDDSYTKAVDNGSYKNFVHDSAGYGLVQWTYWSRKQALLNHAKARRCSIGDLDMQLTFLWQELLTYSSLMKTLKNAKSVREASDAMMLQYERPADQSESARAKRAKYAQAFYDKFAMTTIKSTDEIAKEVLKGLWGNGDDRRKRLTEAGYNYEVIQRKVNVLLRK